MWKREIRYPLCLLNMASPSVQEAFLGCGRRAHLFPTDGLSLTQSAAHQKSKSPPETLAKHVPLSHVGHVFLSDYASPRACLLLFPWVTDVANSQSSVTNASTCTNLPSRKAWINSPVAWTQLRRVRCNTKCTVQFCCWRRTNHGRIVFHYCKSDR